jgi:hypothetical protein
VATPATRWCRGQVERHGVDHHSARDRIELDHDVAHCGHEELAQRPTLHHIDLAFAGPEDVGHRTKHVAARGRDLQAAQLVPVPAALGQRSIGRNLEVATAQVIDRLTRG